ncbi:MAG: ImmA/IrrE family metallo-endopeptidase [Lachnospirales bacterium]
MIELVNNLVKKYKTNNPIELAGYLNINILFEELGTINGYYNTVFRSKFIHINSSLEEYKQKFTIAHELGHAILHPKANTPFLRENTLFSIDKLEKEANLFAVNLIISDDDLKEYKEFTINQLSSVFGIHEKLIELRLRQVKYQ